MLMPGKSAAKAAVTLLPRGLLVFPGVAKPENLKSFAFTSAGFLQTRPLTMVGLLESPTQKAIGVRRRRLVGNESCVRRRRRERRV